MNHNIFAKSAAAITMTGLMAVGFAAPVCAAENGTETRFSQAVVYYLDENGVPIWTSEQCQRQKKIDIETAEPGKYYILETYVDPGSEDSFSYRLIQLNYVNDVDV
ncbi:MAG: hypothetical protein HUJ54_10105 [Erysipelotrichaceae bacterium]|nr:hypothetical protein [Erysipelotrichaceae bacterium]